MLDWYFIDLLVDKIGIIIYQLLMYSLGLLDYIGGYEGSDYSFYKLCEDFFFVLFVSLFSWEFGMLLEYFNVGYMVFVVIIEDVSGMDYESFLIEVVLDLVGMDQMGYCLCDWEDENFVYMYFYGFLDLECVDIGIFIECWCEEEVFWYMLGNGGFYMMFFDMGKWYCVLQDGIVLLV